jgi:hypothetical protein
MIYTEEVRSRLVFTKMSPKVDILVEAFTWLFAFALIAATISAIFG